MPVLQNAAACRNIKDRSSVISLGTRRGTAELAGSRINESRWSTALYCFEHPSEPKCLHTRHCTAEGLGGKVTVRPLLSQRHAPTKHATRSSYKLSLNAFKLLQEPRGSLKQAESALKVLRKLSKWGVETTVLEESSRSKVMYTSQLEILYLITNSKTQRKISISMSLRASFQLMSLTVKASSEISIKYAGCLTTQRKLAINRRQKTKDVWGQRDKKPAMCLNLVK